MFTLTFIICINGMCQAQAGPTDIYNTQEECHRAAGNILMMIEQQIARGEIPPHTNDYQCVSWGRGT